MGFAESVAQGFPKSLGAEIDYLKEVSSQLGLALRGYGICKQVLEQHVIFQQKVNEIIDNNQQLSRGDLIIQLSF